jgi:hypothetical protein
VSTESSGEAEPALVASAKNGAVGVRETGAQPENRRPDADRERLLRATRQVLERSGWWGFKVDSVLRQARLSTGFFIVISAIRATCSWD